MHPQIVGSSPKEIHYFDNDENYKKGNSWYLNHFEKKKSGKLLEATPRYLYPEYVPKRVFDYNPNIKLIIILRNPTERAFSAWNMYSQMVKEDQKVNRWKKQSELDSSHKMYEIYVKNGFTSFEEAISAELDYFDKKKNLIEPSLVKRGLYKQQIENWLKLFPKNQFYITSTSSLKNNLEENLQLLLKFIGVDEYQWESHQLNPHHKRNYESSINIEFQEKLNDFYTKQNKGLEDLIKNMYQPKGLCLE